MATIGKLSIMLTAGAGAFLAGMKKAGRAVKGFGASIISLASPMNLLKGAIGALALGGITALATKAIRAAAQLAQTSRLASTSAAGFATLQHAIRGVGGDAEAVSRGLNRLNEILSGIGPEADFARSMFQRFGASVSASADNYENVRRIADAVAATTDPLQKASLAFAAFGDDAGSWLPILNEGAAGIDKVAERANKLGLSFNEIDARNIEKVNGKFNEMEDVVTGISRQSAVELSNKFLSASDAVEKIAGSLTSIGNIVRKVFRTFTLGWDLVQLGGMGAVAAILIDFTKLFEYVTRGLAKVFKYLGKLPDYLGGNTFKGLEKSLNETANIAKGTAQNLKADVLKAMKPLIDDLNKGYDGVEETVARRESAIKFGNKLNAGGSVQAFNKNKKIIAQFVKLFEETQTPMERFKDRLQEFDKFLQGTGNLDKYSRGVAGLVNELEKAHDLSAVKLAGSAQAGSVAAASAINQSEALNNRRLREKPEDRVRRIMEQSVEIEKQQLEYMKRIAEAYKQYQPVRVG